MGVDDIPMASWPGYSLTTIAQPLDQITQLAVDDLLSRIQQEQEASGEYLMRQGVVIERSSTLA